MKNEEYKFLLLYCLFQPGTRPNKLFIFQIHGLFTTTANYSIHQASVKFPTIASYQTSILFNHLFTAVQPHHSSS